MKTDALIILDGYGLTKQTEGNAIAAAKTPYIDYLLKNYPHTSLSASGLDVGLPNGQMGNSEVGHLNIGAGRVVYQDITAIDRAIEDGSFFANPAFITAMTNAKNKALHLVGLASDGGVHSHLNHLYALIKMAKDSGVKYVYIHCITDGRDTPPKSAIDYVAAIEKQCKNIGVGQIATIVGRYYYMDRDNRWDRVEKGYNCVFEGEGQRCSGFCRTKTGGLGETGALAAIAAAYKRGETDEFITPTTIDDYYGVSKGDSIIFYNFRADRAREITRAAIEPDFDIFKRKNGFLSPLYIGMTQYDASFAPLSPMPTDDLIVDFTESPPNFDISDTDIAQPTKSICPDTCNCKDKKVNYRRTASSGYKGILTAFEPKNITDTLGETLSKNGKTQARIAETEKYAHVTFFFNGGVEAPNSGESRHLIESPKVATYDLMPIMSAKQVADKAIEVVGNVDALILNFANCDMIGHTGDFNAAVVAVETVDDQLKRVIEAVLNSGGTAIVTSDHGNAETMLLPDLGPMTAHTSNPVPFILVGENYKTTTLNQGANCKANGLESGANSGESILKEGGKLCDIAPTLLQIMQIEIPAAMTGKSLIS